MTDRELEALLRNAPPPVWPQSHWETFPGRVGRRLQRSGTEAEASTKPRVATVFRFAWAGLVAAFCVVLGLWLAPWRGREGRDPLPMVESARLVEELTALFPDQLRALIIQRQEFRIVLSEGAAVSDAEPVLVRLCRNGDCVILVTFSGQQIEVENLKFEVLADGTGEVLLVGADFVWSRRASSGPLHWNRVEAATLTEAL
jgi:hypothetical protein